MTYRKSFYDWKQQLGSDKRAYIQAKKMKKEGHTQQTGYKIVGGKEKPLYAVEYYGRLYRESLAGYKRALKRAKLKLVA